MCGIVGIINFDKINVVDSQLNAMMKEMKHRGPDDEGFYIDNNVGLGFVRLSILDLSLAGHQPMFKGKNNEDGERYVIVFNGEIYNYIELREELKKLGHTFKTGTDTEVLLAAYIEWGEDCQNKLNGMWAFAIYDQLEKSLFVSRDRFGIKPFYYYQDENKFIFASEIPPILKVLNKKVKQDDKVIFNYLVFNRVDQVADTFFADIKKLPHSHTLRLENQQVIKKRWYALSENVNKPFSCSSEFRELFSSSIGLRLRSDVPIGICLSGGLDSSSIVSILLKDHGKNDLNTFSAVYGGDHINKGREWKVDETKYINEFKGKVKNMYYTTPSAQTFFSDILPFIRTHAEPVSSTAQYAQYKVMELAKEHVVVTLDGQGGDEQLAGYHYFFGVLFKELLYKFRLLNLLKETYNYKKLHKSNFALKMFLYFLLPPSLKAKLRSATREYIDTDFFNTHKKTYNPVTDVLYSSRSLRESLVNHFEYKLEHLLKWEDRNSMRFSIEARIPFLDYRLVERTLSMKSSDKISNGITKRILRDSMQSYLPDKILNRRDDVGFDTPEDEWFREPFIKEFVFDIIESSSFKARPYFDVKVVKKQFNRHLEREINVSRDIWKWINLELWFREYID